MTARTEASPVQVERRIGTTRNSRIVVTGVLSVQYSAADY